MLTATELPTPEQSWELPVVKPLDEAIWSAWIAKGQARELRINSARLKTIKWVAIAALIATSVFWFAAAPYAAYLRFAFAMCSLILMFKAVHTGRYLFAAVFAGMVVFYNPLFPVFTFAGVWQRLLIPLSAVPFALSLAWHRRTKLIRG